MNIARSQLCPKTISITGKAKEGVKAILAKMTVVGHTLLLAMHRVFG